MIPGAYVDPLQTKKRSEQIILNAGGKICDWLPYLDQTQPRSLPELVGRALVMNALLNIHFQAPVPIIRGWIDSHGLAAHLSNSERALLSKSNADLSEQEH